MFKPYIGLLLGASLLIPAARVNAAHNIFDDDWTAPKSVETPAAPSPPVQTPSTPDSPATPHVAPPLPPVNSPLSPEDSAPAPASDLRQPIPSPTAQKPVRAVMKEVYAPQLADHSVMGRRTFADRLLTDADKSAEVPVDHFVLLTAAIQASIDGQDVSKAFVASHAIAGTFAVDESDVKADAACAIGAKPSKGDQAALNVSAIQTFCDELEAQGRIGTALKVCTAFQTQAASIPALRVDLQKRQKTLTDERAAATHYAQDLQKLTASPTDPAANLSAGRYLCGLRKQWPNGLPLLAKGGDPALASLAAKELAVENAPTAVSKLADAWWELAPRQPGAAWQAAVLAHAADLYESILDQLTGLNHERAKQRIDEARNKADDWVELLPLMVGMKQVGAGGVVPLNTQISTVNTYSAPVTFRIVVKSPNKDTRIHFAADQIIFDWEGNSAQLRIDGGPANGQHKGGAGQLPIDQWATIQLSVSPQRMTISVDGEVRQTVNADFSKINQTFSMVGGGAMVKSIKVRRHAL